MRVASPEELKSWTAFQDLCAMLAPGALAPVPARDDEDWAFIVQFASEHMASPAVWRAVEHAAAAPEDVKTYFRAVREMNAARNKNILDGLDQMLALFEERGIKSVLLKGGASLVSGLYDDPAERFLLDLDVLVEPGQAAAADAVLRSVGYTATGNDDAPPTRWFVPVIQHLPALTSPTGGFVVEIHTGMVGLKKLERMIPAAAVMERAISVQWNGRSILVPRPTDFLVHNIVHSQLHHELHAQGTIELRQLRELAFCVARHRDELDWIDIERRFADAGRGRVLAEQAIYSKALMGVAFPIATPNPDKAINRLRATMTKSVLKPAPRSPWAALATTYLRGVLITPRLALNLLNPLWWPARLRLIRSILRGERTP
ncbi:MAG: nucleotidyltransferase family protein [Methylocystis sp.]